MNTIKTYQDLLAVGEGQGARMAFVGKTIEEYKESAGYRVAVYSGLYYSGENPTINHLEKIIYDLQGRAHVDMFTANHKLASHFFRFAVDQEVSYLLGNGIGFSDGKTTKRLPADFDQAVMDVARAAKIGGVAYGFYNLDRLYIFPAQEFVPLYDEETGALMAGIRFWQLDREKPLRVTLYEADGFTSYRKAPQKQMELLEGKKKYKVVGTRSAVGGTEIVSGENYQFFPIVPLKNGRRGLSEIVGKRNSIDALDLVSSSMVNNVDEGALIYWVLKNCGGMDDLDDARFIERLKTVRVAHADGDDGAEATPHTVDAPFEGTAAAIDMLKKKLYEDFQIFDASAVTAGNQTATAIKASYIPLDLNTDKFEAEVTRFILGILRLAGIDDVPTYTRNQIINRTEETQALLLGAAYYDDEYITKKLLTLNGDIDQYEEMAVRKAEQELGRTGGQE